jgi:hypothetical protein
MILYSNRQELVQGDEAYAGVVEGSRSPKTAFVVLGMHRIGTVPKSPRNAAAQTGTPVMPSASFAARGSSW